MWKITENADELIMREIPLKSWIIGAVLATPFLIILILGASAFFELHFEWNNFGKSAFGLAELTCGFAFFLVCFVFFASYLKNPQATVTVRRQSCSVEVTHRTVFGKKTARYYFHQIKGFEAFKLDTLASPKYEIRLILKNHSEVGLFTSGANESKTRAVINKLHLFILNSEA